MEYKQLLLLHLYYMAVMLRCAREMGKGVLHILRSKLFWRILNVNLETTTA